MKEFLCDVASIFVNENPMDGWIFVLGATTVTKISPTSP